MADLTQHLKNAFEGWDEEQSGLIPADVLLEVIQRLDPAFPERELLQLLSAADTEGTGLINCSAFVDFLTSDVMTGPIDVQLPGGMCSDAVAVSQATR
mmetsp:Transcript_86234/g.192840  ORF Transcript_86234/g.192840 Transcript_86234/m.192840 type:complete len:98 (-) Transcript_86234:18-311(-)